MATVRKIIPADENPNDPNVRDPEHKHELGGTLGMTVGGVAGGLAAGVALAGTTIGTAAGGPLGAIAGAAIGGALGGLAGEEIARQVNPTAEEEYWAQNYQTRPYVRPQASYETYRPAYRYGVDSFTQYKGQDFDSLEPTIRDNWGQARGDSNLEWEDARDATRDAYERLQNRTSARK